MAFPYAIAVNLPAGESALSPIMWIGNLLWRKGLNGAAPTQFPCPTNYYLDATTVLPVVRAGTDLKAYILSSPDLAVRTVSGNGDFEKVRTIPIYRGNVYFQDFFISSSGWTVR